MIRPQTDRRIFTLGVTLAIFGLSFARSQAADAPAKTLPPALARAVDFHKEVVPILARSCAKCHTGDKPKGDFRFETRELLLKGGESGEAVIVNNSAQSLLIQLVAGFEPKKIMPAQGPKLTGEQIGILRAWIDQGMKWEEGFKFGSTPRAALAPRKVALPPISAGLTNPIDRLLAGYFKEHKVDDSKLADDATFARRVSLDLVGLLPSPEALVAFVADKSPDKRAKLIRALLDNRQAYTEHWLTFWNDMLRNAYRGTGYIDGGRKQITQWLYAALQENKPYNQFVRELVSPVSGSDGFINGFTWRGTVNASQRREMQAAQNIGQVILGTNLKCASCHDSFINDWKLADVYGLAAVFADGPLEINRCDTPTGEKAVVRFVYPELGSIDAKAAKPERMKQLAELLLKPENGRLPRTMVNRLWASLMGRGIVEPVDDMDQPPLSAELLDWLAEDFVASGYDIKHTLELICNSRAYQLATVGHPRPDETNFVFRGPLVKRMSAEQFADAVFTLTNAWPQKGVASLPVVIPAETKFAFDSGVMKEGEREIDLDVAGQKTLRLLVADAGDGGANDWANWGAPRFVTPAVEKSLLDLAWQSASSGYGNVERNRNIIKKPLRIAGKPVPIGLGTHSPSEIVYAIPAGATRFKATIGPDTGAVETAGTKVSIRFMISLENAAKQPQQVRAALVNEDNLTRALGRPNRELVVSRRDSLATTLQALEMTNGQTLDKLLKAGAAHWLKSGAKSPREAIAQIYQTALGRAPSPEELIAAEELVGEKLTPAGLEDLLWVICMLPEFQLIY